MEHRLGGGFEAERPAWERALPLAGRRLLARLRRLPDHAALRAAGATIGRDVYLGRGTVIDPDFAYLVEIGDGATLSIGVLVLAHDASTKHMLDKTRIARVRIGERVFVGANSIILPGVDIGDEAIVGAGSVVRQSVPAQAVVAGNPARQLSSLEDYAERHTARLGADPVWPRDGWTSDTGITPERVQEVRAALAAGEGYID
jgi:maltose O-acetyltransferase